MTNFISNEQIELQKNIADEVSELLLLRHGESPKAFVHTYGCQGNVADSERIKGLLTLMGYVMTEEKEEVPSKSCENCSQNLFAFNK